MPATATKESPALPAILQSCIDALDAKKAESIRILYVGEVSSITDYFIIATGTSNPHLKALSKAVIEVLDKADEEAVASGVGDQSGWVVVDAFSFMVHLFTEETRAYYNLEGLWKDGALIEVRSGGRP
jgi:ribosome-associated protein